VLANEPAVPFAGAVAVPLAAGAFAPARTAASCVSIWAIREVMLLIASKTVPRKADVGPPADTPGIGRPPDMLRNIGSRERRHIGVMAGWNSVGSTRSGSTAATSLAHSV
jgi:hypothetical protein